MKKIVYIGLFNLEQMNAAGKRVLANAKLISTIGREVILLGVNPLSKYKSIRESEKVIDGIRTFYFPANVSGKLRYNVKAVFSLTVRFLQEEGIDSIEAIIYYGSPSLALYIMNLTGFARKNHIKIIADVVDWLSINTGNLFFDLFKKTDMYIEKGILNKKADGAIVISSYLEKYYKSKVNDIIVLPPLTWEKAVPKSKVNNTPVIVYAGYPFRKNNKSGSSNTMKDRLDLAIDYLYEVYKAGIVFRFEIYGLSQADYLAHIPEDLSKIEQLGSHICFHGKVSMEEVNSTLKKADYTVLVRDVNRMTSAGFPTKVPESISAGIPVITTRTSDIEKYTIEGKTIFFLDGDKNERVASLCRILSMKDIERIQCNHTCIEKNPFDISRFQDAFESFYRKLICEKTESL